MAEDTPGTARDGYAQRVRDLLDRVDTGSGEAVGRAAELVLGAVGSDGLVYVAGSGHSLALVYETFYRAGGLAAVRPLWDPAIVPLSGARRSTRAERREGLGASVVAEAAPTVRDAAVVFSTSGRNPYPVEVARECAARGVPVIAVTSAAASEGAAARAGSRVVDHAAVVLDTAVPPGDAVYPPEAPRTAAVSTILSAYAWSLLLAALDDLAVAHGVELPRWTSANVPGGDGRNAALMERYGPRVPGLVMEV
ncbi:sugar isomerase domain-containing protein [Allosalinactinospora lopnorensis]|uniref:sugar isomerase domain-containing protein n=1 Tax=Allosalinactinospora lopnorensis TaxID=1352348 RepID=UPI000623D792|nr:sugar isomerase domain-containing protein [Allosalinactinospora lopnorensis]